MFSAAPSVETGNIWIYFISHWFYIQQVLFALKVSSLLSPLNDTSIDIVDDKGSFQFFLEGEFTSTLYVHVTLATDTEPCYNVKNMLKLLTFKWCLNKLLLKTECLEVMLIW